MIDDLAERYRLAGWWTGRRLVDRFEAHVTKAPCELAVVSGGDTLSRSELWDASGEAAEEIRRVVGGGRRVVVVLLPNCMEWVVMFLGVLRAGHVPATLPVTTPEAHLRYIFDLVQPVLAVCAGSSRRKVAR